MAGWFQRVACRVAEGVGTYWAFLVALCMVLAWGLTGPLFHWSDTWQLVINTGTTIVTFLMVFLIQTTQNRDSRAVHLKLDELIRSHHAARNVFADVENATDDELKRFQEEFRRLREAGLQHLDAVESALHEVRRSTGRRETDDA